MDKHGEGWWLWMSLRPPTRPGQKSDCILCAWNSPSKEPGQLPILSIVSCHSPSPTPELIRKGLPSIRREPTASTLKIYSNQRPSPSLWAPIFLTRLWTISVWNTEAKFFFQSVFQKKRSRNSVSTKCLSFKLWFLYLIISLPGKKKKNQERVKSKLSAFQTRCLMMSL